MSKWKGWSDFLGTESKQEKLKKDKKIKKLLDELDKNWDKYRKYSDEELMKLFASFGITKDYLKTKDEYIKSFFKKDVSKLNHDPLKYWSKRRTLDKVKDGISIPKDIPKDPTGEQNEKQK